MDLARNELIYTFRNLQRQENGIESFLYNLHNIIIQIKLIYYCFHPLFNSTRCYYLWTHLSCIGPNHSRCCCCGLNSMRVFKRQICQHQSKLFLIQSFSSTGLFAKKKRSQKSLLTIQFNTQHRLNKWIHTSSKSIWVKVNAKNSTRI